MAPDKTPTLAEPLLPKPSDPEETAVVNSASTQVHLDAAFNTERDAASLFDGQDRFRCEGVLGEGGMGVVFKAWDQRLNRTVALKFLRNDDPTLVRRFEREARAQAGLEHENICRIFDVGAVKGHPYIAMHYVHGASLEAMWRDLSLEQSLNVVRLSAEALHEAHRKGLIHRDVKPANIGLEQAPDGSWKPFVMDFGLARSATEEQGVSITGEVLGTPHYMAPEQARADSRALDRRTDIFSLGATLYYILSGEHPFKGASAVEVMMNLLSAEAVPLRKVSPFVPVDVETIVMKCLERDPRRRYDSAKALADDLRRFLDGEPVLARRAGLMYLVGKKIRKHRALSLMILVAALGLLTLGGFWIQIRNEANRQAVLAQRLGVRVREIESILRYAAMMPLHDIRPEKAMVRRRMEAIRQEMKDAGALGRGPALYALGRGHLALGEYPAARDNLEEAWNVGWRTPETEYALGLTLGELYRESTRELSRIADPEIHKARKSAIAKEYRLPALHHLQNAQRGATAENAAYAEGLLAYFDERYDESIQKARQARGQVPWLYETYRLEADALAAKAKTQRDKGAYEQAVALLDQAAALETKALAIARSDPSLYKGAADLLKEAVLVRLERGQGIEGEIARALDALRLAQQADPEQGSTWTAVADIHFLTAEDLAKRGQDPTNKLRLALHGTERALNLAPEMQDALHTAARAHCLLGQWAYRHGQDPRAELQQADVLFKQLIAAYPNNINYLNNAALSLSIRAAYEYDSGGDAATWLSRAIQAYTTALGQDASIARLYFNRANTLMTQATLDRDQGRDPSPSLQKSISDFQAAIRINPNNGLFYANLGGVEEWLAKLRGEKGEDPAPGFRRAVATLERAVVLRPDHSTTRINLGLTYCDWGEYAITTGTDAADILGRAVAAYQEALRLEPGDFVTLNNLGNVHVFLAQNEIRQGRDPSGALQEAERAFRASEAINPKDPVLYVNWGWAWAVRADWELAKGANPSASLALARSLTEKSATLKNDYHYAYLNLAGLNRLEAVQAFLAGRSPEPFLSAADGSLQRARALNPQDFLGLLWTAENHLWLARLAVRAGQPVDDALGRAETALQAARAQNPSHPEAIAAQADIRLLHALALHRLGNANWSRMTADAISLAEEALRRNPRLARAKAVLAALLRLQAENAANPAQRDALAARSETLMGQAAQADRRLPKIYDSTEPPLARGATRR